MTVSVYRFVQIMKFTYLTILFIPLITSSCIKDDFIDDLIEPSLKITSNVVSLKADEAFQFEYQYLNNIGQEEIVDVIWSSSDTSILEISDNGVAQPKVVGNCTVSVSLSMGNDTYSDSLQIQVGNETILSVQSRSGSINTTSTYALSGDFTLSQSGDDLILELNENYTASTALPGLYIYLSNNPSTTVDAYEIGAVQVFSGAHSYTIPNTDISTYNYVLYFCKPFNVKVGHGEIQ